MLLPGCTALTGEDWADSRNNGADPGVVVDYNLENYVSIPVAGQAPIKSLSREGVDVAVEWKDSGGNPLDGKSFVRDESYKAVIILKAKSGYVFDPDVDFEYRSNLVTVRAIPQPAESMSRSRAVDDDEIISVYVRGLEAEYPPAKIPEENSGNIVIDYNLQNYVPIPVANWKPVKYIYNRQGVEGSVVWKDSNDAVIDNLPKFVKNGEYRAEITLKTKGSYAFDAKIPFSYPEGSVEEQPSKTELNTANRVVYVVYKPADAATPVVNYDLTPAIPAPVSGEDPVPYVGADDEYSGLVLWSPRHAKFQEGVRYTAAVFLYAGPGRYFQSTNFSHEDAQSCLNHPTSLAYRSLDIRFFPAEKGENGGDTDQPTPPSPPQDEGQDIDFYIPL
ncbi:MAG: hypothetical protein LBG08_00405 [Spirochaetaceae bacterium]|jgi:hypothetical protein|nr:hypothetical protein [Spirochaetaceae bacterium]